MDGIGYDQELWVCSRREREEAGMARRMAGRKEEKGEG